MSHSSSSITQQRRITHCLFDMDGLLLDTERLYTVVTANIVARYGKTFEWSLKVRMMGLRERDAAELLVKELGIPMTAEEYLEERNREQNRLFPSARPLPGVERLINHLKKHSIPIAVATSSHRGAFELKTSENRPLFDLFDAVVTGDHPGLKKGKPAPDIFLEAASQLQAVTGKHVASPDSCLVFEDAPSGVRAGLAAGAHVCWVPDERADTEGLLREMDAENVCVHSSSSVAVKVHDRVNVVKSLELFRPEDYGLPPFDA